MVVLVTLTAEEVAIARDGSIPEPSFRPWPGTGLETLERAYRAEAVVGAHEPGSGSRHGRAAATAPASYFPRLGSAELWGRHAVVPCLLTTIDDGDQLIIGLGTVEGGKRAPEPGVRALEVHAAWLTPYPVHLDEVVSNLEYRQSELIEQRLRGPMRPLPKVASREFLAFVEYELPGTGERLTQIVAAAKQRVRESTRRGRVPSAAAREAAATSLHLFTPRWHTLTPEADPEPTSYAMSLDALAPPSEDDVITDDAGVFPGWDRAAHTVRGWWEFRHQDRRLLVKNINVSTAESTTGADLVYVRRDPDAFVLVQYKLAETLRDGRLVYRPDSRLPNQVERMLDLEREPRGDEANDMGSYRIGAGFTFVKFVLPYVKGATRPGDLADGRYLPSEYVRRMLRAPDAGPRGGKLHDLTNQRALTSESFAHLVRNTWVGSTGDATTLLQHTFRISDSTHVVLAVEDHAETRG